MDHPRDRGLMTPTVGPRAPWWGFFVAPDATSKIRDGGGPVAEQSGRTIDTPHHSMLEICKVMLDNSARSVHLGVFSPLKSFLVTVCDINHAEQWNARGSAPTS